MNKHTAADLKAWSRKVAAAVRDQPMMGTGGMQASKNKDGSITITLIWTDRRNSDPAYYDERLATLSRVCATVNEFRLDGMPLLDAEHIIRNCSKTDRSDSKIQSGMHTEYHRYTIVLDCDIEFPQKAKK